LAKDKERGVRLDFDASGREIEVVRLKENQVEARLKYLLQFQAGTGLHLAFFGLKAHGWALFLALPPVMATS
jgi:hypothetical protein